MATPTPVASLALQAHGPSADPSSEDRLIAMITLIAFIAILFFIFVGIIALLVGACFHHRRRCRLEPQPSALPPNPTHDDSPIQTFAGNVNPVEAIPITVYSCDRGDAVCAICLEELVAGEEVKVLPLCEHVFHASCADQWLAERSNVCPLCRVKVFEEKIEVVVIV
ncbi:E3 ubiquitin-protein ligase ATL6-like [Typha angustifolia]|uniref:E3 ubiquitin-protein ligase ATL6-like n=1 Tax=Typha angustifolia TaxID=59011 RepID=UPI003C305B92